MKLLKRIAFSLLLLTACTAFGASDIPTVSQPIQQDNCLAYQGSSSTVGNPSPYRKKDMVNKYHGTLKAPESGPFDTEPIG